MSLLPSLYRGIGIGLLLSCALIPFDWSLLPNIGSDLSAPIEALFSGIAERLLPSCEDCIWRLISDSHGLYLLFITSFLIGLFSSLLMLLKPRNWHRRAFDYVQVTLLLYLCVQLAGYGVQKLLMQQFFTPEANTLYTPLGQLEKDILFWTTMGASPAYCYFLGLLEIIPALLLLHYRTRLIGLLMLSMVLLHVFIINLSYDIDVKLYSALLFCIAAYLLIPHIKAITQHSTAAVIRIKPQHLLPSHLWVKRLRPIVYLFILAEICHPIHQAIRSPGMPMIAEEWLGAYEVLYGSDATEKIFLHSNGYLICMDRHQQLADHRVMMNPDNNRLTLLDKKGQLQLRKSMDLTTIQIEGIIDEQAINWSLKPLDIHELPLVKDELELFVRKE